jgi:predicted DNA-binding transcriptional regulator AlpA
MELLLTDIDVAHITGRARSTLQKDRVAGDGIPFVRLGRQVRYRQSDVENYLNGLTAHRSTSETVPEAVEATLTDRPPNGASATGSSISRSGAANPDPQPPVLPVLNLIDLPVLNLIEERQRPESDEKSGAVCPRRRRRFDSKPSMKK